jgi:hypothetical protein
VRTRSTLSTAPFAPPTGPRVARPSRLPCYASRCARRRRPWTIVRAPTIALRREDRRLQLAWPLSWRGWSARPALLGRG